MVYSTLDALRIAEAEPAREVVFFAIGFETTTPPTALAIRLAAAEGLDKLQRVLQPRAHPCRHPRTSSKARTCATLGRVRIDGFIGPAHVSTVIGTQPYDIFAEDYRKPVVIAGFEPLDVMQAILMLVRQVNEGRAEVENQYHPRRHAATATASARPMVAEVFELRERFEWRGLGVVPLQRAAACSEAYAAFDAERRFGLPTTGRRATTRPANAAPSCAA